MQLHMGDPRGSSQPATRGTVRVRTSHGNSRAHSEGKVNAPVPEIAVFRNPREVFGEDGAKSTT
jgi:hypothetical protein